MAHREAGLAPHTPDDGIESQCVLIPDKPFQLGNAGVETLGCGKYGELLPKGTPLVLRLTDTGQPFKRADRASVADGLFDGIRK